MTDNIRSLANKTVLEKWWIDNYYFEIYTSEFPNGPSLLGGKINLNSKTLYYTPRHNTVAEAKTDLLNHYHTVLNPPVVATEPPPPPPKLKVTKDFAVQISAMMLAIEAMETETTDLNGGEKQHRRAILRAWDNVRDAILLGRKGKAASWYGPDE